MSTKILQHEQLSDDTHRLVFEQATRESVDVLIITLRQIYAATADKAVYVVLDMRDSGMLPLRYFTNNLRDFINSEAHQLDSYLAILVCENTIVNMSTSLLRSILRRDKVQYFTEPDKALLWFEIERKHR